MCRFWCLKILVQFLLDVLVTLTIESFLIWLLIKQVFAWILPRILFWQRILGRRPCWWQSGWLCTTPPRWHSLPLSWSGWEWYPHTRCSPQHTSQPIWLPLTPEIHTVRVTINTWILQRTIWLVQVARESNETLCFVDIFSSTDHFLSDGVVSWLEVGEHFRYDFLGVGAIAHSVQEVHCPLSNTHVSLGLWGRDTIQGQPGMKRVMLATSFTLSSVWVLHYL